MLLNSSARIPGTLSARRSLAPPPVHRPSWPRIIACVIRTGFSRPLDALSRRGSVVTHFKPDERPEAELQGTHVAKAPVLFTLVQHCAYGQSWRVCGNTPELGNWDPDQALPMLWSPGDQWFAVSQLPEGKHVEYKHVLYDECTDKFFWVQEGPATNLSIEVIPDTKTVSGPSAAIVGGSPDAPDVWQMERELQDERAAGMAVVEVTRIADETPATEALPYGEAVMEEFTKVPSEAHEAGPRGSMGPMVSKEQPEEGFKPPTDVPASLHAVPPGEVLEDAIPAIPGVTFGTKDFLPTELGVVGCVEESPHVHGSVEIINEMPTDPIPTPPHPRAAHHASGGQPPPEHAPFHDKVAAAAEAAGTTKAVREEGIIPEEPTAEEIAGGAAAAEPAPSAQLEQAHAAGAVPLSSAAMMSDSVAMTPRSAGNAAAGLMGHDQGAHVPHGFVPKAELIDPGVAATETARRHIAHEVEVAASSVRQLVRHTGRMATKFAQSLHIPAGMVAEQAKEASQQVANAAQEAAGASDELSNGGNVSEEEATQSEARRAGKTETSSEGTQNIGSKTAEAARDAKQAAKEAKQGIKGMAKEAAEVVGQAVSEALMPSLDMDIAGDQTSSAVAEQLAREQDPVDLTSTPLTFSDSISGAAGNLKKVPQKVASSVTKALHLPTQQAESSAAQQDSAGTQQGSKAARGSAPGGLKESWDYSTPGPMVDPAVASAPGAAAATSMLPPEISPTAMSGLKEVEEPQASRSSKSPGEAPPENVIHWVPGNTPEEKHKIANLPDKALWTTGGLGGQLGSESTTADQDSWVPETEQTGGYWPSINPPFPSSESKMTGQGSGGGLDQHMASGSQPNSPPPPAPPHPGPNSVRAARVDRSEDNFSADDSARLCSMQGEARQQELSKEFTQPRTPENAEGRYESVADAVQSSAIVPKPGKAAADAAARREAEEQPFEADKPLYSPRLAYMKRAEREALAQEANQQAFQRIPEEYEAGAEATGGVTQEARGDVLEEPAGMPRSPISPTVGEEARIQDIE